MFTQMIVSIALSILPVVTPTEAAALGSCCDFDSQPGCMAVGTVFVCTDGDTSCTFNDEPECRAVPTGAPTGSWMCCG